MDDWLPALTPSFIGSVYAQSWINSSGLMRVDASVFAASGLEASATIKGTIGNFLATALAGSGFNASGPSKLTTVSATNITVSTINDAPPAGGTSNTYPSGLTTCAITSVGASFLVESNAALKAGLSVNASGAFVSGLNASGKANLTTVSATDVTASTFNGAPLAGGTSGNFQSGLTTCALASIGGSLLVESGMRMLGSFGPSGFVVMLSTPIETAGTLISNQSAEATSLSFAIPSNTFSRKMGETDSELFNASTAVAGGYLSVNVRLYIGTTSKLYQPVVRGKVGQLNRFTAVQTQSEIAKVTFQLQLSTAVLSCVANTLRVYGVV